MMALCRVAQQVLSRGRVGSRNVLGLPGPRIALESQTLQRRVPPLGPPIPESDTPTPIPESDTPFLSPTLQLFARASSPINPQPLYARGGFRGFPVGY